MPLTKQRYGNPRKIQLSADNPRSYQVQHGVEIEGGWVEERQWTEPAVESCN